MKKLFNLVSKLHMSGAETLTPPELVEEMLDRLPPETWTDPKKRFLDPAMGTGTIYLCLLQRLDEGLKEVIPDRNGRLRHIMAKQLFGCEIDRKQLRRFEGSLRHLGIEQFERNVYNENSLIKEWHMKFDIVVGNPPYQNSKNKHYYTKFVIRAYSIAKYVVFVTPANICQHSCFRKPSYMQITNPEVFGTGCVSSGSDMLWWIWHADDDGDTVELVDKSTETHQHLSWPISYDIKHRMQRVLNIKHPHLRSLIDKLTARKALKGRGQNEYVIEASDTHVYPVYLSSRDDRQTVWSDRVLPHQAEDKLIVSHILIPGRSQRFSQFSNTKGVGRYAYYHLCTEQEARNIQRYYDSQVYRMIDSLLRKGRYACLDIPDGDWSMPHENWLAVTQEEINYIESIIK